MQIQSYYIGTVRIMYVLYANESLTLTYFVLNLSILSKMLSCNTDSNPQAIGRQASVLYTEPRETFSDSDLGPPFHRL